MKYSYAETSKLTSNLSIKMLLEPIFFEGDILEKSFDVPQNFLEVMALNNFFYDERVTRLLKDLKVSCF